MARPKVLGVIRTQDQHPASITVCFDKVPTDDEMRDFHDHIRSWSFRIPESWTKDEKTSP
jgi:hypothetical protein